MGISKKSALVYAALVFFALLVVLRSDLFLKIVQTFSGGNISLKPRSVLFRNEFDRSFFSARKQERERSDFVSKRGDTGEKNSEAIYGVEYFRNKLVKTFDNSSLSTLADDLREAIETGSAVPLLTLFSTWPDSETDAEHVYIRNLTMLNWSQFRPFVVPVLMTNSSQHAARAEMNGWHVMPVSRTAVGVPIVKDMYMDVMKRFQSTLYAYANGDILFTDSLLHTLLVVLTSPQLPLHRRPLLVAGRRTNVGRVLLAEASTFLAITDAALSRGKRETEWAIDYFIMDRRFPWSCIPDLVIGRPVYDNWLVGHAILEGHVIVVDATRTLMAMHPLSSEGRQEGKRRPNGDYNQHLVQSLHLTNQVLRVTCAPWQTKYGINEDIEVLGVTMPRGCGQLKK